MNMAKSSKDKEKSFQDMLKSFFRQQQKFSSAGVNLWPKPEEYILTPEFLKELSADSPISVRLKSLRDLGEIVLAKRLQEYGVEMIWNKIRDLMSPCAPKESRQNCMNFVRCLVHGQYDRLGIARAIIFEFIDKHDVSEDAELRFEVLKALTNNGKDLEYFEERMGQLILNCMNQLLVSPSANEFLTLLTNLIKFNSSNLDEEIVILLVRRVCVHTCSTPNPSEITHSITMLDACVRYISLPAASVESVVCALCRLMNAEEFCVSTAQLMCHIFGTHLGHRAMCILCNYLQHDMLIDDFSLLRGCVFFIGLGISQSHKSSIVHSPLAVLPSIKLGMRGRNLLVAKEIGLFLLQLVKKNRKTLTSASWAIILDILDDIVEVAMLKTETWAGTAIIIETISLIEEWHKAYRFSGSADRLYAIIEKCSAQMPESIVFRLMEFRALVIRPRHANWLPLLNQLMEKFYKHDVRSSVRIKALDILTEIITDNRSTYEEDMVDKIVLPLLKNVDVETDFVVAKAAVNFLVSLVRDCSSKFGLDVLQAIEKLMMKSLDCKYDVADIEHHPVYSAVSDLIEVFRVKLYQVPSLSTIRIFHVLVNHLQMSYRGEVALSSAVIRSKILDCVLSLRCNSLYQIGIQTAENETKVEYSRYVICSNSDKPGALSPSVGSPVSLFTPLTFPMDTAMTVLVSCLQKDKSWSVLQLVLGNLPLFLRNRSLVLSADGAILQLCTTLCGMMDDSKSGLPEVLCDAPIKFTRSDFHCHVLPVLATLVTYHKQLDGTTQRRLIKCLEFGLVSKCARSCITALTVCTLEMHDTMYSVLPKVLLCISRISATVGISIAILEFLSSLIRLPHLYKSFVEDQYMSIFAIALPYVNPFKFNHNTVALAYHVIAMWFLKCRLPFRRDFVKYIIKGLQSNVLIPLEEGESMTPHPLTTLMEDTPPRRRACSMNEQAIANRRRDRSVLVSGGSVAAGESRSPLNPEMKELNVELTETLIDLMSRYTFAACSAVPKRFSASEFLLSDGQSLTWLVGTRLVTVTTSGCSNKAMKHGLCEKCLALCKTERENEKEKTEAHPMRRRHRSAITRSSTSEVVVPQPKIKDDFQLPRAEQSSRRSDPLDLTVRPREAGAEDSMNEFDTQNIDRFLLVGLQDVSDASPSAPARPPLCNCWCQGWAEILVRRPTGNVSWMMRVQNPPHAVATAADFPLADITTLFLPTRDDDATGDSCDDDSSHRRINSESLEEKEYEKIFREHFQTTMADFTEMTLGKAGDKTAAKAVGGTGKGVISKGILSKTTSLVKETSVLRRSSSSPELSSGVHSLESGRKSRVYSDAASVAEKAKKVALGIFRTSPKSSSGATSKTPNEPGTASDNVKEIKVEKGSDPEKKTEEEVKPKISLRRHLSNKEDQPQTHIQPALLRRGSERSVRFERQTIKSPPLSPGINPRSESSSSLFRDRGHTISGPYHRSQTSDQGAKDLHRSGINPSFVFLQLYHDSCFGSPTNKPYLLPKTEVYERSLKCFDRIPPYETHKIGVVYVGKGQANTEAAILGNSWGSARFAEFVSGLGELIRLDRVDPLTTYIGGLSQNGEDGKFAYIWQDDVMQVIFHVATLMPAKDSDPSCVSKKLHIGNDFVTIVYNDSEEEYAINTIKGQFMYACIVIQPLDLTSNLVVVKTKQDLTELFGHSVPKIISNENLPILARQLALHANLASMIFQSQKVPSRNPYASNWLERLRDLKRLRVKLFDEAKRKDEQQLFPRPNKCGNVQDFTDFV